MTTATKRSSKIPKEIVADPVPAEPSQSELDRLERDRMSSTSIDFLEKVFPEGRRYIQVCAGSPESLGRSREVQILSWIAREDQPGWILLQSTRPGEEATSLATWLETKRSHAEVWFAATRLTMASDGAPRAPLGFLFARFSVPLQDHKGSGGAYKMADRTKLAALRVRLQDAPLLPHFLVDAAREVTAYWMLAEPLAADSAAPLLVKAALLGSGEAGVTPSSYLRFPGQVCPGVIPRRVVTVESVSPGAAYMESEIRSWLGQGTQAVRTKEEQLREVARRRYA